jgi:hypothetical protein
MLRIIFGVVVAALLIVQGPPEGGHYGVGGHSNPSE